jgi:hypothetical protein
MWDQEVQTEVQGEQDKAKGERAGKRHSRESGNPACRDPGFPLSRE